jgi:hypothetical protein
VMPYLAVMLGQYSPETCRWGLSQFFIISGWVGRGVVISLLGLVLVDVVVGGAIVGESVDSPQAWT